MPDLGPLHPQIIHFVVALLLLGVFFRWLSLTGRISWTGPTASSLLLIGTVASVFAVTSGHNAHGPAERIPGARSAVVEHEEWGERTRNIFLLVALLEVGVIGLGSRRAGHYLRIAAAVVGTAGAAALYETAEHGGQLVYGFAGGVGTRTGDPVDVERLLIAGLYHQAQADREAGRPEDAARLFAELARRAPGDLSAQFLAVESLIRDAADPIAAQDALDGLAVPDDNPGLQVRAGLLRVDLYDARGQLDSAAALLGELERRFPGNRRIEAKRASRRGEPPSAG